MTTYYHVPHTSYEGGEDILTLAEIIEERWGRPGWTGRDERGSDTAYGWGETPADVVEETLRREGLYKWEQSLAEYCGREDAEGVSLYTSLEEVKAHLRNEGVHADGRVLVVELPEDEVGVNYEGFAFCAGSISADCIKAIITVDVK